MLPETRMSPLPQCFAEQCEALEPAETRMAAPDLRQIASELTLLTETILQRLG